MSQVWDSYDLRAQRNNVSVLSALSILMHSDKPSNSSSVSVINPMNQSVEGPFDVMDIRRSVGNKNPTNLWTHANTSVETDCFT